MKRLAKRALLFTLVFAGAVALASCDRLRDDPTVAAAILLDKSVDTVERIRRVPELVPLAEMIPSARAVVVLPSVTRAGFLGAAEGGNGVLIARDRDGIWGYPAFYTLASASVGLQAGIQNWETILVVRSQRALDAIIAHQGTLGADAAFSIGWVGIGAEAATTTNLGADVVGFSNTAVGVYMGLSLDGGALVRRKDLNEAFYGAGATPRAIVVDGQFRNPRADRLRSVLATG
jgi:lipid-binding SYLF domain-containing protein